MLYRFGPFDADPDAGEIRNGGVRIRVQDQPLKILVLLLERSGEVITRDELKRELWPEDTYVNFEHGLNTALTRLRQALGDSARRPRFIESVPRRGYRFIAAVTKEGGADLSANRNPGPVDPSEVPNPRVALNDSAGHSQPVQPQDRGRRVRYWRWALFSAVLLTAAVASVHNSNLEQGQTVPRITFPVLPPAEAEFRTFDSIAVSPDNTRLAYTATNGSGESQLWVRSLDAVSAEHLAGTDGASFPFWSPDGRTIGFFANGSLKRIQSSGGPVRTICAAAAGRGGTWNADGVILFSPSSTDAIYLVQATGGTPKPVTRLSLTGKDHSHRWPYFLPDSRHFLFTVARDESLQAEVFVGDLQGNTRLLLENASTAAYAEVPGRGAFVVFGRDGNIFAQPFHTRTLAVRAEAFPIAEHVASQHYIEPLRAGFSVAGRVLVHSATRGPDQLVWYDRTGKRATVVGEAAIHLSPALSPTGNEIVVDQTNAHTGAFSLWRMHTSAGVFTPLALHRNNDDVFPVWSPDGEQIAFARRDSAKAFNLYSKAARGDGADQALLKSDTWKFPTDWSADGQLLLYYEVNPESRRREIWTLGLFGEKARTRLLDANANSSDAVFSPDGRWLAYVSDESGKQEVYIGRFPVHVADPKWLISINGGSRPRWPKPGDEIYYVAPDNQIMAASVKVVGPTGIHPDAAHALFLSDLTDDFRAHFAVSAGGRRFLLPTRRTHSSSPSAIAIVNWASVTP